MIVGYGIYIELLTAIIRKGTQFMHSLCPERIKTADPDIDLPFKPGRDLGYID